MPWKETRVMDQKIKMVSDWLSGEYNISELSRIYSVSRKTLYKWIGRYELDPDNGLQERLRIPIRMPRSTPADIVIHILKCKSRHKHWGARKILAWLECHQPEGNWPAASTTNEILKRHNLVHPRKKRHHTPPYTEPFLKSNRPNDVWSADYKGQFRIGTGELCYPLTLSDSFSRYLLGCWGLAHPAYLPTRSNFERAFQEYGLPVAIRTDNGAPFASVGIGGLSRLAVWFIRLGIYPERIEKSHPEQNGRHERMHRTLKAEAIGPPRKSLLEQQRAFDRFRISYNEDRPHEALNQKTPASFYRRSERNYPARLPDVDYPATYYPRFIMPNGCFKWHGTEIYLSQALAGEYIGFMPIETGIWKIYYSFYPLGLFDERIFKVNQG
jgi:transposase InsO family protein